MAIDQYRRWTLPEEYSSGVCEDCVNGTTRSLPVKDTIVDNEAAAILFLTKQPLFYP